jgi:hypothetical protein
LFWKLNWTMFSFFLFNTSCISSLIQNYFCGETNPFSYLEIKSLIIL